MTRLFSLLHQDTRLQLRYGFYYAAAFVTLVWIVILRQLPADLLPIAVPFVILVDLGIIGFFFIAGMVLFEKQERTLAALVVSPLRFWEYLTAKLTTLTVLALLVSLTVTIATHGLAVTMPMLVLGVVFTSLFTMLVGFVAVARYDSISSFIMPSQLYLLPFYLPLIPFVGWWEHPLFYLIPTQGSILLLEAAFTPIAVWQVAYAVGYQLLWIAGLGWLASRAFHRHIVAREGGA